MLDPERFASLCIGSTADIRTAASVLRGIVEDTLGDWRVALCANLGSKRPMVDGGGELLATSVFGWTDSVEDRWWRSPRLGLDSPLPAACRCESEPFWVNAEGFHGNLPNPFLAQLDLSDFEARAMAQAAIVVPVHMAFGVIGGGSVIPRDHDRRDLGEAFDRWGQDIGVAIRLFLAGYNRATRRPERLPVAKALSRREVECLRWAAIGKTDVEIGMILSRSRGTIRFHIGNAASKLDAINRSQTVFKAAQLGYIDLNR